MILELDGRVGLDVGDMDDWTGAFLIDGLEVGGSVVCSPADGALVGFWGQLNPP